MAGRSLENSLPLVLEMLGRAGQADRVYAIEYDWELARLRNTHEWSRPGVRSYVNDLQDAPVSLLGALHLHMLAQQAVAFHDVREMPQSMRQLQLEFLRQGNRSVLCLPVFSENRLRGIFGFDATRAVRQWDTTVVNAMFDCAELLGRALHGRAARGEEHSQLPSGFPQLIYLRNGSLLRGVPLDAVEGIKAQRNTSEVHLNDGTVLTDARSLKQWEDFLPLAQFMRIHRGAVVRLGSIRSLVRRPTGRWHLTLAPTETPWNVSREALAGLRRQLAR